MKRAWVLSGIVALSVLLGGCGKDESRSGAPEAAVSASQGVQAIEAPGKTAQTQATPAAPDEARQQPGQSAGTEQHERDGLATIGVAQLPRQAVATLRLIEAGGPFPYAKDGIVFGNRERVLPRHPRGYYHEYTVPTPRARDRGARRIVCGGPRQQVGNCFYTDDHYASFKRIAG